ncbi:trigger factor [Megasphaera vaginalis (ex Bordigoni et al. 2020)]|uniref:trigger factor n=1 Tax=Megasphaera vaginalis (ex Bordigoni et al. 2020) TaxID=2045301 RepID=UPI000C7BA5F6|nr:trigger factor [Megasphaera vaginalis (ex Bordigoni et al. 2020)]
MNVTVNEVDQHVVTLHIEVPAADAAKGAKSACSNLANRVNIPGFRKGKAPRKVLENFLGKDAVKDEIFEVIASKAYSDALREKDLVPVTDPDIKVISDDSTKDVVFEATFTKKPAVELGEYKGLEAAKEPVVVSDEDVARELANLQKQHSKLVVAPEGTAIAKDDFAVIDFKGTVDGEAFEGGEGKAYPLQIGSNSFIPGFEEQLIGCKAGESKDVKVTFPDDYFEQDLAGKDAVFAVTIHDVKRSELPVINDEFAKEAGKFESVDQLKDDLRKRLERQLTFKNLEAFNSEVLKKAIDGATVEIPEAMIETKIDQMIEEFSLKLETQKMNLDDYLNYTKQDMEGLRNQYKDAAKDNVRMDLVLEAIAKKEKIEVNDMDLQAEIFTMAQNFGADPKEVYKIILKEKRVPMLVQSVGRKKAASFILSNAVDTNAPKEETEQSEDKPEA